jgi:hypothetical protein
VLRTGAAGRSRAAGRSWFGPCAESSVSTAATATAASPATLTVARADRPPAKRWYPSRSEAARRGPFAARSGSPSAAEWTAASKMPWVGGRSDSCPLGSLGCTGAAKMLGRSAATAGAGLSKEFAIASAHEEEVAAKLAPSPAESHMEKGPALVARTGRRAGAGRRRRRGRRPPAARTDPAASPTRRHLGLLSAGEDHAATPDTRASSGAAAERAANRSVRAGRASTSQLRPRQLDMNERVRRVVEAGRPSGRASEPHGRVSC